MAPYCNFSWNREAKIPTATTVVAIHEVGFLEADKCLSW